MNNPQKKNLNIKRAFTISEAAEYACVSRNMIDIWMAKGLLRFEELPGRGSGTYRFRRIRKNDIDNFLNQFYRQNSLSDKKKKSQELILLPRNT
ncbi:hypothetical protein ACFL1R_11565 [Candidatus Latescibacterota bacterium]